MTRSLRSPDFALLLLVAASLVGGALFYWSGSVPFAHLVWLAGALPIVVALAVSIVQSMLRREGAVDILALLAIGFSLLLGEYLTAIVIALMVASGRALEHYAQERARREMTALLSQVPRQATRFEAGQWHPVDLESVQVADRLLVRSGEIVPVDGSLTGHAELNESTLTGESLVQRRAPGEAVRSGVLNAGAPFEMVVSATARDSTLAGIVRMVRSAQKERSPATRLADRYALFFVLAALAVAGGSWLVTGDAMRGLAVLVVATPCPLILAVPVAIVSGMSRCARRGVLVKGGGALERLALAEILFFDKTGTLTGGEARVVAIESAPGCDRGDLLRLAASLAQASSHVISEAVTTAARERDLALSVPSGVKEEPGAGVNGIVDGRVVTIGSFAYVSSLAVAAPWSSAFLQRVGYEGTSAVFVAVDGVMTGAIQMADRIRLETPRALRLLRREGIRRLVMLTGDRADVAETVGAILGVTEVRSGQTPADKLAAIQGARSDGTVIMVGDGVNDAPALAAADVGVAMGARGAAASAEAADIVLLVDRLDRLVEALRVARGSRHIAVQSVIAGIALSLAAMMVAAFGYLPPLLGAILQELIDVAVIVNALRALRIRSTATPGSLAYGDAERLKAEHMELGPVLEQIRALADELPRLPGASVVGELARLNESLSERLVPHEQHDDTEVYPGIARLLGGEDPMAAMSSTHREIFRVTRLLKQMTADVPPEGPTQASLRELQRLLYSLDAIVRLHCAQEEELFHTLGESA